MVASSSSSTGPYAIMRIEKIKTLASLDRRCRHIARTQPVENSDPDAGGISVLAGSSDPAADARQILASLDRPPRKNAVLAVEVFMGASPEWWKTGDLDAFCANATAWLDRTYGPGRTAHVALHLDEASPHLHAIVIPWVDTPIGKRGRKAKGAVTGPPLPCRRLDCAGLIGTSNQAMRDLQTSFAEAMAGLGLKRGLPGSRAVHTRTAVWKGRQKAAAEATEVQQVRAQQAATFALLAAEAANMDRKQAEADRRVAMAERKEVEAWSAGFSAVAAGELVDACREEAGGRRPVFASSVPLDRQRELRRDLAPIWDRFAEWLAAMAAHIRLVMDAAKREGATTAARQRMTPPQRSMRQVVRGGREWNRQMTR